jgi:hypothetical protein
MDKPYCDLNDFSPFIQANALITKIKKPSITTKGFLIMYTEDLFTVCFGGTETYCKQIFLIHNKENSIIAIDGFFIFVIITTTI